MPLRDAIVLAAGGGARMWPFATVRNKCAMPVGNVPNVRRLADALARAGVQRVAVVVGARADSVRRALLASAPEVRFVEQPAGGGTAGAVLAGMRALDAERFLVLYGDTVVSEADLRAVIAAAGENSCAALVTPMPSGEGWAWYGARVQGDSVIGVVGHDAEATERLCGVLALDRSYAVHLEASPGYMACVPVGGMPPLEPDLFQAINDRGAPLAAVWCSQPVVDMDKPWHVLQANALAAQWECAALVESRIDPSARVHDGAEIDGAVALGPGSVIGNRVVVRGPLIAGAHTRIVNGAILEGGNLVGDRCRISDYCLLGSDTVVGHGCIVGHGAEMDGVLFDGAYLWHYCEISGVVGASVDIGAATVCGTLRFDDGHAEHRVAGRRERPRDGANATYIGDYSRTGVNAVTMPGAKIGSYACVGAGVIVYEDVPDRTLTLLKQETIRRPWGPERYGW
ncbi:MAG TPA: NTP transferase domain-containing protein [Chthonomonadales bacterium]|nr:NTP transferase domain-containing protein [Chthonomonadales bacterium]